MFANKDGKVVKLGDFGLSKIIGEEALLHTACGTPGYVGKSRVRDFDLVDHLIS